MGYRAIITTDSSRPYQPNTTLTDPLHYRPVEIDYWYPAAAKPSGNPIPFVDFVRLLEERSNRFQKDTVYRGLTTEMMQYLSAGLEEKGHNVLPLAQSLTHSFRNAAPANQRFPLIVYMCSFNGMSYENINLFEWLAGQGYVVACITSVGRYPGNMSTNKDDLLQQVDDGLFAMQLLKGEDQVDPEKVGVIGYSWGGLAALVMTMRSPMVKATLSFDGSEMHYYGESKEEDDDFNALRRAWYFDPKRITAPYTYFESGQKHANRNVDSIYNILTAIGGSGRLYPVSLQLSH